MKGIARLRDRWQVLIDTVIRFPLTIILLIAAAVSNAIAIESYDRMIYSKLLVAFILGASVFVVLQMLFERFFENPALRLIFMVISIAAAVIYYLCIQGSDWNLEITIRSMVIYFILLIAFLWIPVIQSRYNFNDSFMAVFKGFFVALLFDGVLFLGVVLIIGAINQLIFQINDNAIAHAFNLIFIFMAPTYLLTMLPVYPGEKELTWPLRESGSGSGNAEKDTDKASIGEIEIEKPSIDFITKMVTPNKFLISLISYVIIPITAIFTIILLLYIIMNIGGEFWTNNLMEPLLVSYSITVIVVYLMTSTINNVFTKIFRKIFPKVLIPVVLFQTISSIMKITDVGITYGRYYVILFGIFATIAGALFCFLPVRKNGIIAPILIVLSLLSILPPVDAFTISKVNQINRLESVLKKNNMLIDDTIVPRADVSEEDQADIIKSVDYIINMEYNNDLPYLASYAKSLEFEKTFGFAKYGQTTGENRGYYISRDTNDPIAISGYDVMLQMSVYNAAPDTISNSFEIRGASYMVHYTKPDKGPQTFILENAEGRELVRYEMNEIYQRFDEETSEKTLLPTKNMTFIKENEEAAITLVANSISYNKWADSEESSADLFIFVQIK